MFRIAKIKIIAKGAGCRVFEARFLRLKSLFSVEYKLVLGRVYLIPSLDIKGLGRG